MKWIFIACGIALIIAAYFYGRSQVTDNSAEIKTLTNSRDSILRLYEIQKDCTAANQEAKALALERLAIQIEDYEKLKSKYEKDRLSVSGLPAAGGIDLLKSWTGDSIPGQ